MRHYPIMNKNPTMNSTSTENSTGECNLFRAILQHAPYGIMVCDEPGEITFANQLATFLLQQDNLDNRNLLDILATVPSAKNIWKNLLSNDRGNVTIPFSINQGSPDNDDNVTKLSLHLSVLKDTPNRKNSIVVFIEDLSLNETLGAADQYYTDSLENLVDEKSKELEFIHEQLILSEKKAAMIETSGAVAHELRQPLTAIIGVIELLATDNTVTNNPRLDKRFKTIRKQSLRMAEIIKQMEQLVEYKTRPYINGSLIIDLEESSQNK